MGDLAADAMRMGACDFLIKGSFTDFELETAIRFSCYRKQKEAEIYRLATRDPLTGLANRAMFLDRLGNALTRERRSGGIAALLYLDIDGFNMATPPATPSYAASPSAWPVKCAPPIPPPAWEATNSPYYWKIPRTRRRRC